MLTKGESESLHRIAVAFERIADAAIRMADEYAPQKRERKPATLGVATYSEEERQRSSVKKAFEEQARRDSPTP